ncbi:MAG: glycerophosphodiester phosphodiesterase family protein [Anaerolineales bacterium]
MIAHRGASAFAPENTLAAFRRAEEIGAHGIELDAKLSADGCVVVHHDLTLERTTNGEGLLRKKTLAELRQLDAGSHFDPRFRGEQIPTLEEVFTNAGPKLLINVELTNYGSMYDKLVPAVAKLIRRYRLETRVLLSSFSPIALLQANHLCPDVRTGLLVQSGGPQFLWKCMEAVIPHDDLHPPDKIVDGELLRTQHDHGRYVRVWTVNEPGRVAELAVLGVDAIISDDPKMVLDVLRGADTGK